jgi:hypothetical protein
VDTNSDGIGDLGTKEFQVIKTYRKNGTIQLGRGSKTVVSGSYLEIISPEFTVWEEAVSDYIYPYIFTADDSEWEVDVCAEVPTGYDIVGVYDENGDLLTTNDCTQSIVAGETTVVAFEVVDLQSPPPHVKVRLTIRHRGKSRWLSLESPGYRRGIDNPGQGRAHRKPGQSAKVVDFDSLQEADDPQACGDDSIADGLTLPCGTAAIPSLLGVMLGLSGMRLRRRRSVRR